jgi:hypothetical protein
MTEHIVYWIFGLLLGCAATVAIGRPMIAERGRRIVPVLAACGIAAGVLCGWAINAYVDYVRASATLAP